MESAAWKSRVLPAGDDRQEEANKRAEHLGERTAGNPTRMMIYPLVSCGRSLKTVPWAKRCNRLPLLKPGANLSALSSERSMHDPAHRRCRFLREDRLTLRLTRSTSCGSNTKCNARVRGITGHKLDRARNRMMCQSRVRKSLVTA